MSPEAIKSTGFDIIDVVKVIVVFIPVGCRHLSFKTVFAW